MKIDFPLVKNIAIKEGIKQDELDKINGSGKIIELQKMIYYFILKTKKNLLMKINQMKY